MANTAATPENTPSNAQKSCVVCGAGSHRSDWVKKSGNHVACDHHSDEEIKTHVDIANKNAAAAVSAPKPATTPLTASTQKPQPTQAPTTASVPAIGATPNTPKTATPKPDDKGVVGSGSPAAPTSPTPISGAKQPAITPTTAQKPTAAAPTKPGDTVAGKVAASYEKGKEQP